MRENIWSAIGKIWAKLGILGQQQEIIWEKNFCLSKLNSGYRKKFKIHGEDLSFFLKITMFLGQKSRSQRQIQSETFFWFSS